jgi:hypothetical protein
VPATFVKFLNSVDPNGANTLGWNGFYGNLSTGRDYDRPTSEFNSIGFRVATFIPEPSSITLVGLAVMLMRCRERR